MLSKRFCLLVAFLALLASSYDINPHYSYTDFSREFKRTYTGQQYQLHKAIFDKNYAEMLQDISKGIDRKVTDFMDWNQTQHSQFFNFHPNKDPRAPVASRAPLRSSSSLEIPPTAFDWRDTNKVTPVKTQGPCGSCWSFVTAATYESLLLIHEDQQFDLSEQYMLQCDANSFGCDGGYPQQALTLAKNTGIPLDKSFPYQGNAYHYSQTQICENSQRIKLNVPILTVTDYASVSVEQLEQWLVENGPMPISVFANNNAFKFPGSSGLIDDCPADSGSQLDHTLLLVGYTETHWILKNSWGESWGENGFGYVSKEKDCGIRSWVTVVTVNDTAAQTIQDNITLTVNMTDSKGDGWNLNILGFKQGNKIVGRFGENFTSGDFSSTTVTIPNNFFTEVVVVQEGSWSSQVGFDIYYANGSLLTSRKPGSSFPPNELFFSWCPNCTANTIKYSILLTDSWGDGWNGNILSFVQNETGSLVGQNFVSNATYGPIHIEFEIGVPVNLLVHFKGTWTEEVGLEVRDPYGQLVFKMSPGTPFESNSLLGTFTPGSVNLKATRVVRDPTREDENDVDWRVSRYTVLLIVSIVLAVLVVFFAVAFALAMMKYQKVKKQVSTNRHDEPDHGNPEHSQSSEREDNEEVHETNAKTMHATRNMDDFSPIRRNVI